jgi:hypothetical protein
MRQSACPSDSARYSPEETTMEINDMEIYTSPEIAEKIQEGSVVTISVSGKKQVGNGWLISGSGQIVQSPRDTADRLAHPVVAGDSEYEEQIDLVGHVEVDMSKAISSFSSSGEQPAESSEKEQKQPVDTPVKEKQVETSLPPATQKKLADNPEQFAHKENGEPEQLELDFGFTDPPKPGGVAKPSFGERGPQLIGMDPELELEVPDASEEEKLEMPTSPLVKGISSVEEFYKFLEGVNEDDPAANAPQRPVSRAEAVAMEHEGALTAGPQMYIVNTSGGQLVLSDIDIRMRYGDSYNLSRVPAARLKRSSDLFEAIQNNLVKFVTPEEAIKSSRNTERRLMRMEQDIGGVEVYDNTDDIYDDIEFGGPDPDYDDRPRRRVSGRSRSRHPDDPMPRFDVEPQVRQAREMPESRSFRRGIKSRSRHPGGYDDYYDDYDEGYDDPSVGRLRRASVRPPRRFRDMGDVDVLRDDRGEMDMIFEGVEQREMEIESVRSSGRDPFEDSGEPVPEGRPRRSRSRDSADDGYDYGDPRREIDEFRRESYRDDGDDKHVRVSRISW